jgi:hypothetical protein
MIREHGGFTSYTHEQAVRAVFDAFGEWQAEQINDAVERWRLRNGPSLRAR